MIINAGVRQIVYEDGYPDALAAEMLGESGIKITQYRKSEPARS
jgi:dCMP deaminase